MQKGLIALIAVILLAGCQRPEQTAGTTAPAKDRRLQIAFIPKNEGNPYFEDLQHGFEDACKEQGCDVTTVGPAKADATSQIPTIKDQIQRQVDVIAISPNSPDALNSALDEAKAKGILVITVDADLDKNESHRAASVLGPSGDEIAKSQLGLLGSWINYEGEIAILSATKDAPNQNAWIAKMQDMLKNDPKFAKMKLVEIAYGDDEPQKSLTEAEALLSKHPNLKGIISPTTVGVAAAAQALETAGVYPGGPNAKNGGVLLTGLGTPDQMRGYIDKGVVKGVQLWSPHDIGYVAGMMAIQMKSGKLTAAKDAKFTAGKLGERTFEDKDVARSGPLVTFDKGSIGNYHF